MNDHDHWPTPGNMPEDEREPEDAENLGGISFPEFSGAFPDDEDDEENEDEDAGYPRYEDPSELYSQEDESSDLQYENNVEQYTQIEYQYRICKDRMAYLLDELRRRVPQKPEQWEGWGYVVPHPEQPGKSPMPPEKLPENDTNLPLFELLPRFWPREVWENQVQNPKWQEPQGEPKDGEEAATKRKFFYQKVGPDIDPAAGPPAQQLWHWILNVVVEEIQWVESRDRLQEIWKIRWADHRETYAIVAKYAGWK